MIPKFRAYNFYFLAFLNSTRIFTYTNKYFSFYDVPSEDVCVQTGTPGQVFILYVTFVYQQIPFSKIYHSSFNSLPLYVYWLYALRADVRGRIPVLAILGRIVSTLNSSAFILCACISPEDLRRIVMEKFKFWYCLDGLLSSIKKNLGRSSWGTRDRKGNNENNVAKLSILAVLHLPSL